MDNVRYTILLVEDDEDDFILTRAMLADSVGDQFDLDWVASFQAALQEACSGKQYDVCLIDYRLGDRDGLDLVRELNSRGCQTPMIVMTGQGSYDVDIEAMRAGAVDYLVKSEVTPALLERTIRYAIERFQAQEALQRARDELEQRVQERTKELAQANTILRDEITERKRIEMALRESESRFRTLAETTSSAIFILQDDKIRYVNPAVKLITGFEPAELLEKDFVEIAHPSYRKTLKKNGLVSQWAEEIPVRFELKMLTRNGEERWVDITSGKMEFGGSPAQVVTAFDITERDLAEQALQRAKIELEKRVAERTAELRQANHQLKLDLAEREQLLTQLEAERARLSTIIAHAPEGIVVSDRDGRILLANPVAEQIYARPIPYGKDFSANAELKLGYPDGTPCLVEELPLTRSVRQGVTLTNVEMSVFWPDDQLRSLLVSTAPILDRTGVIGGAVMILQDITQHKQNERQRLQDAAHIELQHHLIQYREMERLHIAQDLHDGPLQDLIGVSFLLADTLKMASDEKLTDALTNTFRMLQQQIQELRAFCSELRPPTLAPFGLEKAIRSHADTFQTRHSQIKVQLDLEHDGQKVPEKARLALFRIYQELMNNALRHSEADHISVRFRLNNQWAELEVVDNGIGFDVPADWVELARQGHLGLVGVRERVEAANGQVEILSSSHEGAAIRVRIPWQGKS